MAILCLADPSAGSWVGLFNVAWSFPKLTKTKKDKAKQGQWSAGGGGRRRGGGRPEEANEESKGEAGGGIQRERKGKLIEK